MRGGGGADLLDGGPGINTLSGGADADVFRFPQGSASRIGDCEDGLDRRCIQTGLGSTPGDLVITGSGSRAGMAASPAGGS
ncbi:hypothetical protein [Paracoccus sp. (in: a-proteobacteria)]|uniref:hypothetical protein n=1 Tax=Paracoccus sp. TaxID=267 RepID=UPI0034CD8F13